MLRKKEKSIRIEIGKKDMELCGKRGKTLLAGGKLHSSAC